jgi:hypothetical protein
MANPYSHRFLAWAASMTPPAYIVPTGYIAIIRDADIWSGGGSIINWTLSVNGVAKIAGGAFTVISEQQVATFRGRQVVQAGEQIVFASDGATDGMVSGYLLTDDLAP